MGPRRRRVRAPPGAPPAPRAPIGGSRRQPLLDLGARRAGGAGGGSWRQLGPDRARTRPSRLRHWARPPRRDHPHARRRLRRGGVAELRSTRCGHPRQWPLRVPRSRGPRPGRPRGGSAARPHVALADLRQPGARDLQQHDALARSAVIGAGTVVEHAEMGDDATGARQPHARGGMAVVHGRLHGTPQHEQQPVRPLALGDQLGAAGCGQAPQPTEELVELGAAEAVEEPDRGQVVGLVGGGSTGTTPPPAGLSARMGWLARLSWSPVATTNTDSAASPSSNRTSPASSANGSESAALVDDLRGAVRQSGSCPVIDIRA